MAISTAARYFCNKSGMYRFGVYFLLSSVIFSFVGCFLVVLLPEVDFECLISAPYLEVNKLPASEACHVLHQHDRQVMTRPWPMNRLGTGIGKQPEGFLIEDAYTVI